MRASTRLRFLLLLLPLLAIATSAIVISLTSRGNTREWAQIVGAVCAGAAGVWILLRQAHVGPFAVSAALPAIEAADPDLCRCAHIIPLSVRHANTFGNFDFYNSQWSLVTGRTQAQLLEDGWLDLVYPEDRAACVDTLKSRLKAALPFTHDFSLRRPDGQWTRFRESFVVHHDRGGRPLGMLGVCQDQAPQHAWHETLLERERELADFFEKALMGVHVVDPAGVITAANPAELRLLGYSHGDFVGQRLRDIYADPSVAEALLARSVHGESTINQEVGLRTREGAIRTVLLSTSLQWEQNQVRSIRCFTHDITEWRLAESKFREHTLRFESLAAMAPVGIFHTDAQGRYLYVNDRWQRLAGTTLQEAQGDGWHNALHPEDREHTIRLWNSAVERGREFRAEFRFRAPSGEVLTLLSVAAPVRDHTGTLAGYVGTVTDITESKQARDDLYRTLQNQLALLDRERSLRRELDHRVRNNLASLIGLVRIYEREGRTDADVLHTLQGKIVAMKDVHETISRGDGGNVNLIILLNQLSISLIPAEFTPRVFRTGPAVTLSPSEASAIAMIFQELVTNSLKHGALGTPDGSIKINWETEITGDRALLNLNWSEKGRLHRATIPHGGSGVGLPLIAGFARVDLRGAATFHDNQDEWRCHLLAELSAPQGAAT